MNEIERDSGKSIAKGNGKTSLRFAPRKGVNIIFNLAEASVMGFAGVKIT